MKITRILVPVDFSESCLHAFQTARSIATKSGADVHLVHYCTSLATTEHVPVETEELMRDKNRKMQEFMKSNCQLFSNRLVTDNGSVGFAYEVILGMAGDEIPEYIRQHGIDLVVMGRRSQHNALDRFLGSVSSAVIDRSGCPVLLIPMPCQMEQVRNVAFCTNEDSIGTESLAYANYWSGLFRSSIHYVHVGEDQEHGEKLFSQIRDHFRNARTAPLDYRFANLAKGSEEELNRYAGSHQIDLFITVHRRRTFLQNIFHRSFTMRLSHVTGTPLLVIN